MSEQTKKKRIDEISMLKGLGILYVFLAHMSSYTGVLAEFETFYGVIIALVMPTMMLYYMLSGYTASVKDQGVFKVFGQRTKRILLPYYLYAVVMIVILALIYLVIEKRTLAWFADGTIGILLQFQAFHFFDPASAGIHPMFYGFLVGWFLFQLVVSEAVFLPILYKLKGKKSAYKLVAAFLLLLAGAILYKLNLQHLNGEFFPTVCKIFILPNIPGIAALMLIGNFAADMSLFDFDWYPTVRKIVTAVVSFAVLVFFIMTDDHIYDFPIGKWGAFGFYGYFLTPFFGLSLILLAGIICNLIKKVAPIKNILIYTGDNSMDYLMLHLFVAFLVAYVGGFWYEYLSEAVPKDDLSVNYTHYAILAVSVFALCTAVIEIRKRIVRIRTKNEH